MADLSGVTTNYLPTAHETFADTTSASITAGDATVYITNLSEYTDDEVVVLTVEPGTANEATFTGVKKSSPFRVINCKWTEGNVSAGHGSGVTVIDYDSATHYNMLSKALKQIMNQNGTLQTTAVQAALGLGADALNGWNALGYAPNTVVDNGNGSYTATFNGVDLTGITGVHDRMLLPRAATLTQCANLNGTTHYFSKASPNKMTWTDDFVASAWIKLTSYSTDAPIVSRIDGTQGWWFGHNSSGQLILSGHNAALANYSRVNSNQSVPLSRWVHVAALLDMSAFTAATATAETAKSWVMINGVEVPATVTRNGTNPTTLVQAGILQIGTGNTGGSGFGFIAGKIAQVAIYNTRVLQSVIRASRNQPLVGNETGLASAYSLSNSLLDLNTTTPNDLTANGGVTTTSSDTPFTQSVTGTNITAGTRNYALIMAQSFSTNTVYTLQVAEGDTIPITTPPTSVSYSKQANPYGFPSDKGKWELITLCKIIEVLAIGFVNGFFASSCALKIPIGAWQLSYSGTVQQSSSVAGIRTAFYNLSDNSIWTTSGEMVSRLYTLNSTILLSTINRTTRINLSSVTTYTLYGGIDVASGVENWSIRGDQGAVLITALPSGL